MSILPYLVERYSTAEHPAEYVIEFGGGKLVVTFTCARGTYVGVGKTEEEAAMDVRTKLVAIEAPALAPKPRALRGTEG